MPETARIEARHSRTVRPMRAERRTDCTHASVRKSAISNQLRTIHHQSSIFDGRGFALIVVLLAGIVGTTPGSTGPAQVEQALAVVQDCMARSPGPWPDAWQREYVDTIRDAIASHQDAPQYAVRLEILGNGFQPYWEGLEKNQYRPLFEVDRAQIRWDVEHLMIAELPDANETDMLRDQCRALWDHAARSLLTQFPFLDPNAVQTAKADHLAQCYRHIEAPLLPIFLHPFSQAQLQQIKQRWHDLRYARVDLWRQLGGKPLTEGERQGESAVASHPDYLLTERSLAQLQACLWAFASPAPDYYRKAVTREIDAQKRRARSLSTARRREMRLGNTVLQTEYISFLLAALLESPPCFAPEPPHSREGGTNDGP